jgi:hypothetical protein
LNRHNATTPMARPFSINPQRPQMTACCASRGAKNPHGLRIVALWRDQTPNPKKECACQLWRAAKLQSNAFVDGTKGETLIGAGGGRR